VQTLGQQTAMGVGVAKYRHGDVGELDRPRRADGLHVIGQGTGELVVHGDVVNVRRLGRVLQSQRSGEI
jgi:hypothetical protein